MYIGPFHFTPEVSFGNILTMLGMLWISIKYLSGFVKEYQIRAERIDKLWYKFTGHGEDDPNGWFNRLEAMEKKVDKVWERLRFNRVLLDNPKTRHSD